MALRLLAGPFDIVSDTGELASNLGFWFWYKNVGIVSDINWARSVVTLDGVYQQITTFTHQINGWWMDICQLVYTDWATEYTCEPKVFLPTQTQTGPIHSSQWIYPYVRRGNQRFYARGGKIHVLENGVIAEYSGTLPASPSGVGEGRGPDELFVAGPLGTDAQCFFYDVVKQEVSSEVYHLGMSCSGLVYAPEYGVLVSLHTGYKMRVWSLEVEPNYLSEPSVLKGELKGGRLVTYQVQALGAQSDPCEGELVDWSLSGAGMLLATQSTTDSEGYATVQVRYGLSDSGFTTVEARLVC